MCVKMTTRRSVLATTRRSATSPAMTFLGGWIHGGSSSSAGRDGVTDDSGILKNSSIATALDGTTRQKIVC